MEIGGSEKYFHAARTGSAGSKPLKQWVDNHTKLVPAVLLAAYPKGPSHHDDKYLMHPTPQILPSPSVEPQNICVPFSVLQKRVNARRRLAGRVTNNRHFRGYPFG